MHPGDGREGLSGISITAQSPNQTVTLKTSGQLLEIHYLQQFSGGAFEFSVDGRPVESISTKGEPGVGIYQFQPDSGDHDYRLRTLSSEPVRLFGWVSDRANGITFETLGINGAQANMIRGWDPSIWQAEVASRRPALVILQYGTNEANSPKWTPERYIAELHDVLMRVRAAAAKRLHSDDRSAGLREVAATGPLGRSREPAAPDGPAVSHSVLGLARTNGRPRAMVRWAQAGYGQADHIHLTGIGYRLIGRVLVGDLMTEYNAYLAVRSQRATASYDPTK